MPCKMLTKEEFLNKYPDEQFRYMLLDRMRSDCEYFINASNCNPDALKFLWASEGAEAQIAYMRYLWESFENKPTWLTKHKIDEYEAIMVRGEYV